ncbi:MAG: hypothetical protein WCI95_02610 [bacterium]
MSQNTVLKMALGWFCFSVFNTGNLAAVERPVAAESNIVITAIQAAGQGRQLQIDYPDTFSDRLDIYMSTNLQTGGWWLLETNLTTAGSNTMAWTDLTAGRAGPYYYLVGNADLDTDQDGLADAREILIHHTQPLVPDSDADGIPDGAELQRGTGPLDAGSSATLLYADSDAGSDGYDGLSPEVTGGHGPKRSLSAASAAGYSHDVIMIKGLSLFREPSLCIGARDVTLCPLGAISIQP